MVPLNLGGCATPAPSLVTEVAALVSGTQPLKAHGPTGKGVKASPATSSSTAFLLPGLQNLPCQSHDIVLPALQPQGPSVPSSSSHSFPESIQPFKNKSVRGVVFEYLPLSLELKFSEL